MASIIDITNPLTGAVEKVDQLDHTAQEIDNAVSRALPGGEIDGLLAGKAPAGYGLGENPVWGVDADLCVLSGWYVIGSNVPKPGAWVMRVDAAPNSVYQTAYARKTNSGVPDYVICRRYKAAGSDIFSTWEYVNPPMLLGEEYRTTERYLGKPVYVKLLDCGLLVKGTLTYPHGISDIDVCVRYSGVASTSTGVFSGKGALPSFTTPSALNSEWNIFVQNFGTTNIDIYNGGGLTGCPVYVTVWYTKTTD